jgi:hypothetical protein
MVHKTQKIKIEPILDLETWGGTRVLIFTKKCK